MQAPAATINKRTRSALGAGCGPFRLPKVTAARPVLAQVYEFTDASGSIYIADPPPGVPLTALLAQALSRALGSPVPLPLAVLLACPAGQLPGLRAALVPQVPAGTSASCPSGPLLFPCLPGMRS